MPAQIALHVDATLALLFQPFRLPLSVRSVVDGAPLVGGAEVLKVRVLLALLGVIVGTLGGFFGAVRFTGSHRGSIRAVAGGKADIAAIDCVAWALALRHEPAAGDLKVIGRSPNYPSLPFITGNRRSADDIARIGTALRRAVADLPGPVRDALHLNGIEDARPADYACLKESGRAG